MVGTATFGIGEAKGFSSLDIAVHASLKALAQAGLTPADVDSVSVALPDDFFSGMSITEYMGLRPKLSNNNRTGGSSFMTHMMSAALALDAGLCEVALIAYGSNQRTNPNKPMVVPSRPSIYEAPYKMREPVSSYALAASRHMHLYGTTREQLGAVALASRLWAQLNPEAFLREPLSMDDYLKARLVSDPLTARDCCVSTDGGAALVMVRADRAPDHLAKPAYVLGCAEACYNREISSMPDVTETSAKEAAARAFGQAGVSRSEIDVVQVYDAFTINPILFLEDLGFCPKGEGGRFVQGGRIAPGGALPTNTNGGSLSCVHPGMYGIFSLVEAAQQLSGLAGQRQVPGVNLSLAQATGGSLSHQAVAILGSVDTLRA